ncbi:hypothetical protein [Bradyrhizobium sp. NP1]|uniref:hypothetical protein n=1 Tax=Bradyrhizobium sp. NP1 TaxID=3049772 RepID=UPI0025A510AB|nr:hypothetical protein [Bradyrhizobium sp. NP1]WJR78220.1 hypothetical protein QOU61_36970 [Bradyrhizobium sp. NP1]
MNLPAARAIAAAMARSVLRVENGMGHLWNVQDPVRFNRAMREAMSGDYPNNVAG